MNYGVLIGRVLLTVNQSRAQEHLVLDMILKVNEPIETFFLFQLVYSITVNISIMIFICLQISEMHRGIASK